VSPFSAAGPGRNPARPGVNGRCAMTRTFTPTPLPIYDPAGIASPLFSRWSAAPERPS